MADRAGVGEFTTVQLRERRPVVSELARPAEPWATVGRLAAIVCLVIVSGIAVGLALQLAAEDIASRTDTRGWTQLVDTPAPWPALDHYGNSSMTIDQLHDLEDQLCPTLSALQRTGN